MITAEQIVSIDKEDLQDAAEQLDFDEIKQLIEWLSLKDNAVRYQSFLLLQSRSAYHSDIYPYWDVFCDKLKSGNSYQRSIGLMLIAENARWDSENKMDIIIDAYLELLYDEKPITIRQCVQSLEKIISAKPDLNEKIAASLVSLDLLFVKETMRKVILQDIINVLCVIRKFGSSDSIESYISAALSGEILDKKAKKQIEALL